MPPSELRSDKSATTKDITRELNILITTVSRVLRDKPDVNPNTRQAELVLAKKLDYQPNQIALSLVTKQTHSIGVIVPNVVRSTLTVRESSLRP